MRGFELYVSIDIMKRLRALASLLDLQTPDHAAEMLLTESLKQYPAIDELIEAQDRSKKAIKEKWKLEHKGGYVTAAINTTGANVIAVTDSQGNTWTKQVEEPLNKPAPAVSEEP